MAKEPDKAAFTKLELRIMQVLWRRGGSTVSAVQAELDPPLAYTTVQTMLNILERKGKLRRELDGRAYVYTAKVTEAKALGQGVRDLVDRMFGGSNEELVMSLLKSRQLDAKRLAELTERFSREETGREETGREEEGQS
jgi:predicted transcriptional regulator